MSQSEGRIDLRAEQDWIDNIDKAAESKGLSRSAYIRLAATERAERDGFPYKPPKRRPRPYAD